MNKLLNIIYGFEVKSHKEGSFYDPLRGEMVSPINAVLTLNNRFLSVDHQSLLKEGTGLDLFILDDILVAGILIQECNKFRISPLTMNEFNEDIHPSIKRVADLYSSRPCIWVQPSYYYD